MHRILLVDDDRELCAMLGQYLAEEGFSCAAAHDGATALDRAMGESFDALVLDLMMPGLNGFEVVRRLRDSKDTPVVILTARGDDADNIVGLEIGADDYLTKPCNPQVLAAHLRAVLRRSAPAGEFTAGSQLTLGDLTLYPGARRVRLGREEPELTSAEFNLLHTLMKSAGQTVTKDTLCQEALGRRLSPYDRSVDIHISNLRRKLGPAPGGTQRIRTVRGTGYLLALPLPS
ncbi:MAG: response regulator transcription factor [Magnetococcales bacterium]|nr:response regulator transcription factor [Magnetococcales bacterium]